MCQFTLTFVQRKGCIEFNNDFSKILFYKIIKQRHKSIFYHKVDFFKNHQGSSYKLLKSFQYFWRTLYTYKNCICKFPWIHARQNYVLTYIHIKHSIFIASWLILIFVISLNQTKIWMLSYRAFLQKHFLGKCGVIKWSKTIISMVGSFVEFYCYDNMECVSKTSLFWSCRWNGKIMSEFPKSSINRYNHG